MKAKDITRGALLWWEPHKYGFGDKVRVIDPRPVYGRGSRWSVSYIEGHGTGVLVEVLDSNGKVSRQAAAQLRHLLGPYNVVKKAKEQEEKANRQAEAHRRAEGDRLRGVADRLEKKGRRRGLSAYAKVNHDRWVTVSLPANQFEAMVNALPADWKSPVDPEEA